MASPALQNPRRTNLTGNVLLHDVDTDALTTLIVNKPSFASRFELSSDGPFIYTPNADFTGVDFFVYVVTDGSGVTSEVNVEIEGSTGQRCAYRVK